MCRMKEMEIMIMNYTHILVRGMRDGGSRQYFSVVAQWRLSHIRNDSEHDNKCSVRERLQDLT